MKVLVDFGHSRCKWALLADDGLQDVQFYSYGGKEPVQCIVEILQLFALRTEIHVVSVLGERFNQEFAKKAHDLFQVKVHFYFSRAEKYEVLLSYAQPGRYGADRYAALLAAHFAFNGKKIVVDCGTAITVDAIDQQGVHLGGVIIPGVELMSSALAEKATGIEISNQVESAECLSTDTQSAVYSGSLLSLRYGLPGIIDEIQQRIGQASVIASGGAAAALLNLPDERYIERPNLVLEGIKIMVNGGRQL